MVLREDMLNLLREWALEPTIVPLEPRSHRQVIQQVEAQEAAVVDFPRMAILVLRPVAVQEAEVVDRAHTAQDTKPPGTLPHLA